MEPANFVGSNGHLDPPKERGEDVSPLYVYRDGEHVLSCWKPTAEELDEIQQTGRCWLWVKGPTMPPVVLTGHDPFAETP